MHADALEKNKAYPAAGIKNFSVRSGSGVSGPVWQQRFVRSSGWRRPVLDQNRPGVEPGAQGRNLQRGGADPKDQPLIGME